MIRYGETELQLIYRQPDDSTWLFEPTNSLYCQNGPLNQGLALSLR